MGIAERREREKLKRKNQILDAAEELFLEKGINRVTMDEVAESAELSKGTLYLYFKSKEELYFAISKRALDHLLGMFQSAVKSAENGIQRVRAIGLAYMQYAQKYPKYFSMIAAYEAADLGKQTDLESFAQCHLLGRQVLGVVAQAIQEGISDGSIRSDLDPMQTAFLLQGQSTGVMQLIARETHHIEQFENFTPGDLLNNFFDFMFNALKAG